MPAKVARNSQQSAVENSNSSASAKMMRLLVRACCEEVGTPLTQLVQWRMWPGDFGFCFIHSPDFGRANRACKTGKKSGRGLRALHDASRICMRFAAHHPLQRAIDWLM